MPRGERLFLTALAGAMSVLLLAAAAAGHTELLAYAAPVALVVLPLLGGRYVGEQRIARLRRRFAGRRAGRLPLPARAVGWRTPAVHVPRGSALIAYGLAVRPPPRALLLS
jgi:hypothetical protein